MRSHTTTHNHQQLRHQLQDTDTGPRHHATRRRRHGCAIHVGLPAQAHSSPLLSPSSSSTTTTPPTTHQATHHHSPRYAASIMLRRPSLPPHHHHHHHPPHHHHAQPSSSSLQILCHQEVATPTRIIDPPSRRRKGRWPPQTVPIIKHPYSNTSHSSTIIGSVPSSPHATTIIIHVARPPLCVCARAPPGSVHPPEALSLFQTVCFASALCPLRP